MTSPHAHDVARLQAEAREIREVLTDAVGKLPPDHAHMIAELRARLEAPDLPNGWHMILPGFAELSHPRTGKRIAYVDVRDGRVNFDADDYYDEYGEPIGVPADVVLACIATAPKVTKP